MSTGMTRSLKIGGVLVIVVAVILLALLLSDPRNMGFFPPQSYITKGERFGVNIGDGIGPRITKLKAYDGVTLYNSHLGGVCVFRAYSKNTKLFVFNDDSWRKGVICLVVNNERVSEIVWS